MDVVNQASVDFGVPRQFTYFALTLFQISLHFVDYL